MADKLLRFKDILEMDEQGPLDKPLSFNDMHVTQYMPGEDEQVNYRAYRRKRTIGVGEGGPVGEAYDPSAGQHRKGVTPGYDYKHKVVKDPANPKHHVHVHQIGEEDVDEALTFAQRLQRKKLFRKFRSKIKRGRELAKRRIQSKDKLMNRTRKQVRNTLLKKLTKDIPKSELTYARRQELEKRLEKPAMKKRIDMLVKKQYPKVYKAEIAKKRGSKQ